MSGTMPLLVQVGLQEVALLRETFGRKRLFSDIVPKIVSLNFFIKRINADKSHVFEEKKRAQ